MARQSRSGRDDRSSADGQEKPLFLSPNRSTPLPPIPGRDIDDDDDDDMDVDEVD